MNELLRVYHIYIYHVDVSFVAYTKIFFLQSIVRLCNIRYFYHTQIPPLYSGSRLHLATKGPAATCRWLQSVLVSPHHLKVPQAMATYGNNTIKGAIVGASSVTTAPGDTAQLIGGSAAVQDVIGADRRREVEVRHSTVAEVSCKPYVQ